MTTPRTLPGTGTTCRSRTTSSSSETAYLETSYSFHQFRSRRTDAVVLDHAASVYLGTTFDLGPDARVSIGEFLTGQRGPS